MVPIIAPEIELTNKCKDKFEYSFCFNPTILTKRNPPNKPINGPMKHEQKGTIFKTPKIKPKIIPIPIVLTKFMNKFT